WQVETWEAAALILLHAVQIEDVVSATRIMHRLEAISQSVPSLRRYSRLSKSALISAQLDRRYMEQLCERHRAEAPRSFIGWAATQSAVVRGYHPIGEFQEAKQVGASALAHVNDDDREFVALFLSLDRQVALAEAGTGDVDGA